MAIVSLLRCAGYSLDELKGLFVQAWGHIGFLPGTFRSLNVVLKPNLLSAMGPETAVVTHPRFFQAAAELVLDHGGRPVLAESPAVASLGSALRASGYESVTRELGIEVADPTKVQKITYGQARIFKSFEISRAFFDGDVILNLPKFKTHNLTYVTASVKNLFGAVPGMMKSQLHLTCPDRDHFSEAILDLYGAFLYGFPGPKPLVHLMDAVLALEGEGPGSSGKPRPMNAIIAGTDGLAVDWTAVQVSGLDPWLCPILRGGFRRGYGISSGDEVTVKGQGIEEMRISGFLPPGGFNLSLSMIGLAPVQRIMKRLFTGRPVPLAGSCTMCLQCMEICPARAIARGKPDGGTPAFDYGRCIRCWCCMEACPSQAISVKQGALQRFIS
jgi:uncharacterized protein (DUF362 family)/Pyruvate/2-oxoacid:ferredoxin oxidoreductase delta subunit